LSRDFRSRTDSGYLQAGLRGSHAGTYGPPTWAASCFSLATVSGRSRQCIPILDLPVPTPPPGGAEWIEAYRHWWK